MLYLVTYDIATPDTDGSARLRRVAKVCERYGQRVQYSVFECLLSQADLEKMTDELLLEIEPETDSIRVYKITSQKFVLGIDKAVDFESILFF